MSECDSCGSSEALSSRQGNNKLPVRAAQTSLGRPEIRPHPPVTRSSSGPHDQRGRTQPRPHQEEDLAGRTGHLGTCPVLQVRTHSLSPLRFSGQLRDTHISRSTPSLFMYQPEPQTSQLAQQSARDAADASGRAPDWQAERWHVWQILSKENSDALPETLV